MIPFISLYGGGCSIVVDGDRDIRCCCSARVVIIQIIWIAIFVFLGGLLEELDQTVQKTLILTLSNNIGSLDNKLKVSVSLTALIYCLLLTFVFSTFTLLWILVILSHLSVVGLGRCFCLLSPTHSCGACEDWCLVSFQVTDLPRTGIRLGGVFSSSSS
jgi:hypothetical protein